jgi:hypothetical protein
VAQGLQPDVAFCELKQPAVAFREPTDFSRADLEELRTLLHIRPETPRRRLLTIFSANHNIFGQHKDLLY